MQNIKSLLFLSCASALTDMRPQKSKPGGRTVSSLKSNSASSRAHLINESER